jgi:hypothetical protein
VPGFDCLYDRINMQRHFYASPTDLVAVVETVESRHELEYTPMGLFQKPPTGVLGLADQLVADVAKPDNTYLVTYRGSAIHVRTVPQVKGGVRYAIDQLVNPDSITLTSTVWHAPNLAVYGRIATVSESKLAKRIYGAFARAIDRRFRKISAAWVGPEAEVAWRAGARLAIGPTSPREYDLRQPAIDAV